MKDIKVILFFILMAFGWQMANAYDFIVDGLCYNYNADGTSVSVTYVSYNSGYGSSNLGSLIIPSSVIQNGIIYKVTIIGEQAFYNTSRLTSVTIPNSVKLIESRAFQNCTGLKSATIGDSVICISDAAFYNCTGLTSVTIGNSVTSIGMSAFSGCTGLTSMTFPSSVTYIYNSAFEGCSGLTSVAFPNSVKSIGPCAFRNCTGLTSVTIPISVNNIGEDSFSLCNCLTAVYITDLAAWCNINFENIGSNPLYYAHHLYLNGEEITNLIIPNSVTYIGDITFSGCSNLTSVTFHDSLTSIGNSAFYGCSGLTSLTIPNSVKSIGELAFCNCYGLANIYSKIINLNAVNMGKGVFGNVNKTTCKLIVPGVSLGIYRIANQWKDFLNIHPDVYAESISLNHTQLLLDTGVYFNLISTVLPTNAYSGVKWYSSNPNVVSITSDSFNVYFRTYSPGTTVVTATTDDGSNLSDSCIIEVTRFVHSVKLNYTSMILEKGESRTIAATITPSNASNSNLLWSSSNPSVAEVDTAGVVTALSVGSTVISATTTDGSNITATCNVEVRVYANSVTINKHETSIYAGGTEQLTALVLPEDAYNQNVTWRTSNSNVASVSNGLVYANRVGTAFITATCNGISDTCVVTVKGVTSLTLDNHDLTLDIESTGTLNVVIEPQEAINKNLTWRSLNTSIVTVSNTGLVTPKGIGSTRIIVEATDGSGLSDTCSVTVIPAYDLYPTTTELMHVRGQSNTSVVIPFWMSNKTAISGLQFDITLPTGVSFATVDDYPDVWLDANRKARNHTVDVSLISGSKYRVLVSSPTNNTFKGNEGVVLYMRLNVDSAHPIGSYFINTSNVIFVEPDETQHTGYNKSVKIDYKYLLGDADGDARVDVADYTVTALYILNRPTEVFYSDAANVSGDNGINVTDLVGITNISLGIRPHEYRPAPAVTMDNNTQESMPSLNASMEGDNIVTLSIDNGMPLAGMQLDLQLPQGMTLADATLEGRAAEYQLGTNTLADGRVRLLISSFGDKDIEAGNDAVIKLTLEGNNVNNEMLYITGAQAASRDLRSYELNDVTLPVGTTSIDDIDYSYDKLSIYGKGNTIVVNSPSAMTVQLVHVNGMVMPVEIKPGHNTIEVGGHGVYIIRVGNSAYKVRL